MPFATLVCAQIRTKQSGKRHDVGGGGGSSSNGGDCSGDSRSSNSGACVCVCACLTGFFEVRPVRRRKRLPSLELGAGSGRLK